MGAPSGFRTPDPLIKRGRFRPTHYFLSQPVDSGRLRVICGVYASPRIMRAGEFAALDLPAEDAPREVGVRTVSCPFAIASGTFAADLVWSSTLRHGR